MRNSFKRDVAGAAAFPNEAFLWITEVERDGTTFDQFGESGMFPTLAF